MAHMGHAYFVTSHLLSQVFNIGDLLYYPNYLFTKTVTYGTKNYLSK